MPKMQELCERLSTSEIAVEVTEDTRKLDAGIVYYIVHIKKLGGIKRVNTRKTGIYFTRVKGNIIHAQIINGVSMVPLFSDYSSDSQEEIFKYLENILKRDMEFFQNAQNARKPQPQQRQRKEGTRNYERRGQQYRNSH